MAASRGKRCSFRRHQVSGAIVVSASLKYSVISVESEPELELSDGGLGTCAFQARENSSPLSNSSTLDGAIG